MHRTLVKNSSDRLLRLENRGVRTGIGPVGDRRPSTAVVVSARDDESDEESDQAPNPLRSSRGGLHIIRHSPYQLEI